MLVVGQAVKPGTDGGFSTTVSLVPGTNLIDVIASAPHAQPAMAALRVIRYVLVTVPGVTGESPSDAAAAIRGAGLKPQLHGDSDPFAFLLPFSEQVCSQSPNGGDAGRPEQHGDDLARKALLGRLLELRLGEDRLKQLNRVAGRVLDQDLLHADAGDDVIAKAGSLPA